MAEFNRNIIFELYKDKTMTARKRYIGELIKKFKISEDEAKKVFDMVLDYQIHKYGKQLNYYDSVKRVYNKNFMTSSRSQRKSKVERTIDKRYEDRFIRGVLNEDK